MAQATFSQVIPGGWTATGNNNLQASQRYGSGDEPSLDLSFTTGTGPGQIDVIYRNLLTLAAAASLTIDLKGGNSEKDVLNNALSFAKIRRFLVQIVSPGSTKSLKVGPQNVSNPWAALLGSAVLTTDYITVKDKLEITDSQDGFVVSGTSKQIKILNSSAVSVTALIEFHGTSV